jgi:hypothetical protein
MTRARALVAALAAALLTWLLALPGPAWPWLPADVQDLDPGAMTAVYGQAGPAADGSLFVTGTHRDTALQVLPGLALDAGRLKVLRYSARDFPATLELALTWRRADDPLHSHIATLPAPGQGVRSFDLGQLPDWHGTVIELGLGQFPVPHLVQEDRGFKQFHLELLRLESPTLGSGLALLGDNLTAPRPWTHSSINSLGRELRADDSTPALAMVLALAVFVAVWLLLGRRRGEHAGRLLMPVAVAVLAVWLLIDLSWQRQLSAQNRLTRAAAQDGARADAGLVAVAAQLSGWLSEHRPDSKIVVLAVTPFAGFRLAYHLLPLDVAAGTGVLLPGGARPPAGTVLAVYAPMLPSRAGQELRWPELAIAELGELAQLGPVRLYEFRDPESP